MRDGIRRFVDVQSVATQTGVPIAPSHGLDGKSFTSVMTGMLAGHEEAGRAWRLSKRRPSTGSGREE